MHLNNKIIAFCYLSQCLIGCVTPGSGKVLDSKTREPINNAVVTMDCRRAQFHGSKSIKNESDITSGDGVYDFGLLDVIRCNYVYVHAEKDGYVELIGSYPIPRVIFNPNAIPKVIYLTAIPEAEKLYIGDMWVRSRIRDNNKKYSSHEYKFAYYTRYVDFLMARGYSRSLGDDEYISECFCSDLINWHNELSADDKIWLKNEFINPFINYHYTPQRINHEKEVITYCNEGANISN